MLASIISVGTISSASGEDMKRSIIIFNNQPSYFQGVAVRLLRRRSVNRSQPDLQVLVERLVFGLVSEE